MATYIHKNKERMSVWMPVGTNLLFYTYGMLNLILGKVAAHS